MSIGNVEEARALILTGCFLQQCYNMPIEEIAAVSRSVSGENFRLRLPFFTDGLLAISSEHRISDFLRTKVSQDYQRRMSFATQTKQSKQKVRDYVDQISSDWNNAGGSSKNGTNNTTGKQRRGRRATLDSVPTDSFIEIKLIDSATQEETKMRYGLSMPLKTLFKKYAEDRNLSLRELRFSYEGRTLFLSSAGNKSPEDLGIENLDSITVVNNAAPSSRRNEEEKEESSGISSSDESKGSGASRSKGNGKGKGKRQRPRGRRASWSGPEIMGEAERFKLIHSRKLTKVFAEAAPQFEQIRRKLNELNLTCTPPKVKASTTRKKSPARIPALPVTHNLGEGTGGKAGSPFHAVHVGSPENLYMTQKDVKSMRGQKSVSIDLHGMAKDEALVTLDEELPKWVNSAMRGSHPFVIPVVIVCGCGNQILSEAVEGWIKSNESVARAPKARSRRRSI
jgi:DNA-nicking Smr family endonuclease